jgi:hypothetical protein
MFSKNNQIPNLMKIRPMNFLDKFSKNTQMPNLMKIRLLWTELFYEDRWNDRRADKHMTKGSSS